MHIGSYEAIQRLLQPSSTIGLTEHYAESGALQQPASQYHPPACNAIWKLVCQRMYIENLRKCSAESVSMCSDLQKQMSRNALCDAVDAIENTSLAPRTIFFRFRPHRQWDCVCVCACPSSHPSTSLRRSGSRVAVSRLFPASKSALAGLYCSETNGSVHARCPSPPLILILILTIRPSVPVAALPKNLVEGSRMRPNAAHINLDCCLTRNEIHWSLPVMSWTEGGESNTAVAGPALSTVSGFRACRARARW